MNKKDQLYMRLFSQLIPVATIKSHNRLMLYEVSSLISWNGGYLLSIPLNYNDQISHILDLDQHLLVVACRYQDLLRAHHPSKRQKI